MKFVKATDRLPKEKSSVFCKWMHEDGVTLKMRVTAWFEDGKFWADDYGSEGLAIPKKRCLWLDEEE